MAVIAGDLVAWLVGLLAEAGRKRLIGLVIGPELEGPLWKVTDAAVNATAAELRPGGGEPAEHLARVIGEVVRARMPRELDLAPGRTLLEAIGSGVAAQVSVLGDPDRTGQGVSSAEVEGTTAAEIAERLTGHLAAGIRAAGLGGGPLKPLADQLNFDFAHWQNQQAAGILARLDAGVLAILGRLPAPAGTATGEDFAADLRALLEGLADQAECGRLPSYLRGRADVLSLTRVVSVRAGIRLSAVRGGRGDEVAAEGRAYTLAADRDERESPIMPWPEVAAAHDRVVVLADPGLGKSWLVRTETHRLARAALACAGEDITGALIPVPLRCDQLAAAEGADLPARAASFLAGQGLLPDRSCGPLAELIRAGRAVILLDALDELTADEAAVVRTLVSAWAGRSGTRLRCVITSRVAGYTGSPLPGAAEVELQPFTPTDVTAVIRRWGLPAAAGQQLLGRAGDPAVAAMARIPLLLALLCGLAAAEPDSELPVTRSELYERVLRWFLTGDHRAPDDPATAPLTSNQVGALLELLGPVAFWFATRHGGWMDLMAEEDLKNAIRAAGPAFTELGRAAAQVLQDLSAGAGILVPDRDPSAGRPARYLFLHRTFAEYLVARHLAGQPAADMLTVVTEHQWFDPDWQTVIPMLGGQLGPDGARRLMTHLLEVKSDPFWHARLTAISAAGERPDPDSVLTAAQARSLARMVDALLRHEVGRELAGQRIGGLAYLPSGIRSALVACLGDPDRDVRRAAPGALAGREGQDVTAALLNLLDDPDEDVRRAAAGALAGREGQDVTTALFTRLGHPSLPVRSAAMRALAGREGQDVTAALIARLDGPDKDVRDAAVRALAGREGQHVTAALITLLGDPSLSVRSAAAGALAGREGSDVTGALLTLLGDPSLSVRSAAAGALAGREGQHVTAALLTLLGDASDFVRRAAVEALAGREGQDVTAALLTRLNDPDWRMRDAAAEELAGREGSDVTAALITRLGDPNPDGRKAAMRALAGREGQDVTAALITLLDGPDEDVRYIAAGALAGREGQDVTAALIARLGGAPDFVRRGAAQALAGREGSDVTAALITLLDDASDFVRRDAVEALAGREGSDVTAALIALLDDFSEYVRDAAMRALAGRGGQDVTAVLIANLDNPATGKRDAAAKALARRGSPADLLMMAEHKWPQAIAPESLRAAYALTTRHYQALASAADQAKVRARMSQLTEASSTTHRCTTMIMD